MLNPKLSLLLLVSEDVNFDFIYVVVTAKVMYVPPPNFFKL